MNKKIYDSLMKDISKVIKKQILESDDHKSEIETAADKLVADLKRYNKSLDMAISMMKIISKGHEKEVKYQDISYDKLIPELEKRLKERSVNDSYRKRK